MAHCTVLEPEVATVVVVLADTLPLVLELVAAAAVVVVGQQAQVAVAEVLVFVVRAGAGVDMLVARARLVAARQVALALEQPHFGGGEAAGVCGAAG